MYVLHCCAVQAGLEQVLFAPVGQTQFYLGITLLEGRPWPECVQEWKQKLIPTWKARTVYSYTQKIAVVFAVLILSSSN